MMQSEQEILAKTTIRYQYLPVLVSRLVQDSVSFSVSTASADGLDVEVTADMRQSELDEMANESHGGFVMRVDVADVFERARRQRYNLGDEPYDMAETVLQSMRWNLSDTWESIQECMYVALDKLTGEMK